MYSCVSSSGLVVCFHCGKKEKDDLEMAKGEKTKRQTSKSACYKINYRYSSCLSPTHFLKGAEGVYATLHQRSFVLLRKKTVPNCVRLT